MQAYSPDNCYVKETKLFYSLGEPILCQGPDIATFPTGIAEAAVTWDYLGAEINLLFKAGFVGATQDHDTGLVRPLVGWVMN
jgi:hypothetical protein